MKTYYTVTEYIGDYPIEDQMFWDNEFKIYDAAKWIADHVFNENQQFIADGKSGSLIADIDYYVLVEKCIEPNDDIGTPEYAVTFEGRLRGEKLELLLKKYED